MSRSYKKNPVVKESSTNRSSAKYGKRVANRIIRHRNEIFNYGTYRKAYCSWCICDYRFRLTQADFQKEWEIGNSHLHRYLHKRFQSYQRALYWWKRNYIYK